MLLAKENIFCKSLTLFKRANYETNILWLVNFSHALSFILGWQGGPAAQEDIFQPQDMGSGILYPHTHIPSGFDLPTVGSKGSKNIPTGKT